MLTLIADHQIEEIYYGRGYYEKVAISICGNYVVINEASANFPITKRIPSNIHRLISGPIAVSYSNAAVSGRRKPEKQAIFLQPPGLDFISTAAIVDRKTVHRL